MGISFFILIVSFKVESCYYFHFHKNELKYVYDTYGKLKTNASLQMKG
jgi:hypothetical protein